MATQFLKPKPSNAPTHNLAMAEVLEQVQAESDVPFQVRLPESLATKVKVYGASNKLSNKAIVTEALQNYLIAKNQ